MKVAFILPPPTTKIVGGLKVVYQYSNCLCENGKDVTLYYSQSGENSKGIPRYVCKMLRGLIVKSGPRWFALHKNVKREIYNDIRDIKADIVFATSVETASIVKKSNVKVKFYLIQDYENWHVSDDFVTHTYKMKLKNIVVSKWLEEIVNRESKCISTYIPNGIDLNVFNVKNDIYSRGQSIAMLYHLDYRKGADIGLQVVYNVKKVVPELKVIMFGSPKPPSDLPNWIEYHHNANQNEVCEILNDSSIFLCTSRVEGFGLTGLESLACGCALVTTDCLGAKEYCELDNSVVCKIDNVEELTAATLELLFNKEKRISIAKKGANSVKTFNIINTSKIFLNLVNNYED